MSEERALSAVEKIVFLLVVFGVLTLVLFAFCAVGVLFYIAAPQLCLTIVVLLCIPFVFPTSIVFLMLPVLKVASSTINAILGRLGLPKMLEGP